MRSRKEPRHKDGIAAYLVVLLVRLLSVALVFGAPAVQDGEESAGQPDSNATPVCSSLLTACVPLVDLPLVSMGAHFLEKADSPASLARLQRYHQSPLAFEVNKGQSDPSVKYLSRGAGYALFFTHNEAMMVLDRQPAQASRYPTGLDAPLTSGRPLDTQGQTAKPTTPRSAEMEPSPIMRMRFVGANRFPGITAVEQLPGKVSYFRGKDPAAWQSGIPTFARLRYQDLYPGVSAEFYGSQGRLEYDLLVEPGADPNIIAFDWLGANHPKIDRHGNLRFLTAAGEVLQKKPRIYQLATDKHQEIVAGGYTLTPEGHIKFQVGEYDRNRPLIIDPVVTYSTYVGGNGYDAGTSIAVDAAGNAYITGFTRSPNFPVTAGSLQTACGTSGTCNGYFTDAFITKLSATGQLIYSTFLGGSRNDIGKAIAVDSSGAAYIAGQTFSSDFPVTAGAFKTTNAGSGDVFISKLNPSGTALEYSTYLGGSGIDNAEGIAVDDAGNAYVTGQTYSTDFPTVAPIQAANGGNQDSDAFVAEINSSGSALVYSTYLGGGSMDVGNAIALDSSGNAYVVGYTRSTDFPLVGPLQAACGGCPGFADAFVAELAPGGTSLLRSTYLGGTNDDQGTGVAVDSDGSVYVTGFTYSPDFPVTPGAYQTSLTSGRSAAFLAKLAPGFSSLDFATFLQGGGLNFGKRVAVDTGNAFVAGLTYSLTFPLANPTQNTCPAPNCYYGNGFITELNAAGSGLIFSTYLGGSHGDDIGDIALDSSANVLVTGQAASTDFPVTNAFQATSGGSYGDAFVTKISLQPAAAPSPTNLTFASQQVGTTSGAQTVLLTSSGTAPLHIASIAASGDFAATNNCGNGVAAGSTCSVYVTFTPRAGGARTGTLTINDNAGDSPQTVSLAGNSTAPGIPVATLSPSSLSFGNQNLDTTSGGKNIQLKNTGNATLGINSITIVGTNSTDFAETSNCQSLLAPGAQCNISVTFTPTGFGTRSASVSVSDNAGDSPQSVSLTGSGTTSQKTQVSIAPNKLSFGNQAIGSPSAAQTATLTNTGNSLLVFTNIAISGPNPGDFTQTNTCGTTVTAGSNCAFSVTFTPQASGNRSATLNITDNAGGSPQHVSLAGTGTGPFATLNPASLSFANQNVGTTSGSKGIQLKNTGNATLTLSGITIIGTNATDFTQTNNCQSALAPGAQCNVNVTFSPTATGTRTASLSVSDNANNSPQTATLTGTGQ